MRKMSLIATKIYILNILLLFQMFMSTICDHMKPRMGRGNTLFMVISITNLVLF